MIKTNYDYLKSLSLEEMADRNIQYVTSVDIDYDYDENSYEVLRGGYVTSDGERFMDYEDALEHEINWLKSPYTSGNSEKE